MKKILVAVSGGPDSMALLDMLAKEDYELLVVHVNYHVRDNSNLDEQLVKDYCHKHNIAIEVLNAPKFESGNFQAFAREVRYDFMVKIAKKHDIKHVYVAHHLDDVLETYIMQKSRNSVPTYYGINELSNYYELQIVRPLLDYRKVDLIEYCQKNNVNYVVDDSNLENEYSRNLIRNTVLDKMSEIEKDALLLEIKSENEKLLEINQVSNENYQTFTKDYSLDFIKSLPSEILTNTLRRYFLDYDIYSISNLEFENIVNFIMADGNGEYQLNETYILSKAYGILKLVIIGEAYIYHFDEIVYGKYPSFEIATSGSPECAVTLSESDFPITIRSYQAGDKIQMIYGSKSLSRFFIDRKIPDYQRKTWPVVINADKEIVLVPGLGCNITHFSNNPTVFVVK
ncbi:MAG: tRNA lysidine(34) synthetase TilS [Erysipelothrix sp.]|nr:tRNA lysidine(34) synthetase TilS [Erysipelothrix sp.]